jgi:ABC-2 type transport system permease protein
LLLSLIFGFVMLFLAVLGLWVAANSVMDDPISLQAFLKAGLIYLPALWIMTGLGTAALGLKPKFTGITWLVLGYSFFVVYLGGMLKLPEWMANLSPYGHIPQVPVEKISFDHLYSRPRLINKKDRARARDRERCAAHPDDGDAE